ncbi:centromere/kinetochore protein zw10 homolog [Anneissia japonica]|uniref:centromere/kinetochore protein zw10 homolog n=1 Tax=Anneissia japonica TaxID=1529436 RepID=UPI0014257F86|nr:centromere/kinetochore protein zw10 homolog [Anneissia japonica]
MASLVTEILANSGSLEKDDLGTRLRKLTSSVDEIKSEVYDAVKKKYVEFQPSLDTALELENKVNQVSSEVNALNDQIQNEIKMDLNMSTSDLQDITLSHAKTKAKIQVLSTLCKIHDGLQLFKSSLTSQDYKAAADNLECLKSDLYSLIGENQCEFEIVKAIRTELTVHQETLLHTLGENWKQVVSWKSPKMELQISHDDLLQDMVVAMHKVGILNGKIQTFGKHLLEHVFLPIVTNPSVQCVTTGKSKTTKITFKKVNSDDSYVQPQKVYQEILKVLRGLEGALLEIKITIGEDEQRSLMSILGMSIWKDLSDLLIKECLVKSIPTTNAQLTGYNSVITATEEFEKSLAKLGFVSDDVTPLLSYAKDVNIHFANKKCRDILVESRNLMKQDLHNTVIVGVVEDECNNQGGQQHISGKDKNLHGEEMRKNYVSPGTFQFPQCRISITTQQLVNLAYETLFEATQSSQQCATQLFQTTRSMFELYCAVIPTYHKDSLAKFPQLSALHHNNCMYIAHHLLTLGHQYRDQLPPPLCQGSATFVDEIPQFRHLATDCFMEQMRTQRNQVIEYLNGAGNMDQVSSGENYKTTERSFKQVLHQLVHLHAVWSHVLPSSVFIKVMGTLVNTVFQHIVDKIVALEDISTDDANQLLALMTMLLEKVPETLQPENTQVVVVEAMVIPHWVTYKELMFILEASLQNIVDRWVDGKGPLAMVFQPNEVKGLIRALFKNTDRRANALAKIRL